MRNKKGIALILSIGILALLAVLATSFALNMRLEYKAAKNYSNGVKARYLAEAAIQEAIARLREHVKSSAFDDSSEPWSKDADLDDQWEIVKNDTVTIGSNGLANVIIKDEQRKINVNTANQILLENLFGELSGLSVTAASLSNAIDSKRPSPDGYTNLQELKSIAEVEEDDFNIIKDYVTTHSYIDTSTDPDRSPVNINTADIEVLKAVLENDAVAQEIYDRIRGVGSYSSADPFESWGEFSGFIDDLRTSEVISSDVEASRIKNNCNPNRSDDKSTTELCFNSGGVYEITGTGIVGPTTDPLATRTVTAIVKIYDIYNETTMEDFAAAVDNGGAYERVTWLDSCPIDSGDLFGCENIPEDTETIEGSIKVGFWDDFDDSTYSDGQNIWKSTSGNHVFVKKDGTNYTLELSGNWGSYVLDSSAYDDWGDFSLSVFEHDVETKNQMREVGQIHIRGVEWDDPTIFHAQQGQLSWDGTHYAYQDPDGPQGKVIFLSDSEADDNEKYPTLDSTMKYEYQPQIKILDFDEVNDPDMDDDSYDMDGYRTLCGYNAKKTYNIFAMGSKVTAWVCTSAMPKYFSRDIFDLSSGKISLYSGGSGVTTEWDDIRIISPDGSFTSQTIDSSDLGLPAGTNFTWGTITGTISQSEDLKDTPDSDKYGDIIIQTSINGLSDDDDDLDTDGYDYVSLTTAEPAIALNVASTTSPSVQYKAFLTSDDGEMKETPILEDITITYLPKVQVLSWKIE